MKYLIKSIIFFFVFLTKFSVYAQTYTEKLIENDLDSQYRKIWFWAEKSYSASNRDSIIKANNLFQEKLKKYTTNYPITLKLPFKSLTKAYDKLTICMSDDSLLRIYSWFSWIDGRNSAYYNVIQYKYSDNINSGILFDSSYDPYGDHIEGAGMWYTKIYTLKTKQTTYYLIITNDNLTTNICYQGVKILCIENGVLNDTVHLIKTQTGIRNELGIVYDFFKVVGGNERPYKFITYDTINKVINIPIVNDDEKVTKKFIRYKFNGSYFEKIKAQ